MDTKAPFLPMSETLRIFDGKWKIAIIYYLFEHTTLRFGEMRRLLPQITQKMLTAQLRSLEKDGIVRRKVFAVVPPKVEYSLTDCGRTLYPILEAMKEWSNREDEDDTAH